jgi:hypothetical protein
VKRGAADDLHVTGFGLALADPIDPSKGVAEGARAVRRQLDVDLDSMAALAPPCFDHDAPPWSDADLLGRD